MITFEHLTKRYGDTHAVSDLTASVAAGRVTALLGPNGAGKSTTLRVLLGLDRPTTGAALINGRPYRSLREPLRKVGAHLEGRAVHAGRSARAHLLALARANTIPARRVDEVIETVGLGAVSRRRAGTFSLGMMQRLGIAAALLGDPDVLILDEPTNGLDTDGIRWIRTLLTDFAGRGGAVLLSSHVMSELQQTADHVLVLGRGRLLADCPVDELVRKATDEVLIVVPDADQRTTFQAELTAQDLQVVRSGPAELRIRGITLQRVGDLAHQHGMRIHRLTERPGTMEDGYLRLVGTATEFTATTGAVMERAR